MLILLTLIIFIAIITIVLLNSDEDTIEDLEKELFEDNSFNRLMTESLNKINND